MTKVLILGANGQVARRTTQAFLRDTDAHLTLYLRDAGRLGRMDPARATPVERDVDDVAALSAAMKGQDVVFASLAGDLKRYAGCIVSAMHTTGLRRLIFISSMGIYGEVPGERYRSVLDPYRDAAALIEASDLDYTVLRPGWFTRAPSRGYRLTRKGQPFLGHDISLDALAEFVVELATTPRLHVGESLGVSDA